MLLGITRRCRHNRCAEVLHAVVRTKTAGEKTIAVAHREGVIACHAIGSKTASHNLRPHGQVLACVAHDGGISRCTGRCVYAHNLRWRRSLQAVRIVITQILLGCEWQFHDVVNALNILGSNVHLLHLVAVERYVVVNVCNKFLESFALQCAHLVTTHTLLVWVPNHSFIVFSLPNLISLIQRVVLRKGLHSLLHYVVQIISHTRCAGTHALLLATRCRERNTAHAVIQKLLE